MSCYSDCTNIPFWKFAERKACMADCDAQQYNQIAEQQVESQEASTAIFKWLIPVLVVVIILFAIGKKQGWL